MASGANAFRLFEILSPQKMYLIDPWRIFSWDWVQKNNDFTDELIELYKEVLKSWDPDGDSNNPDKTFEYLYQKIIEYFRPHEHVQIIRGFSQDVVDQIPDHSIDILYVDGNHTEIEVFKDLATYNIKISSDGIIMGNDFLRSNSPTLQHCGVIEGVLKFCHQYPEWHLFAINKNQYADFILSKDTRFDETLISKLKNDGVEVETFNQDALGAFLKDAEEIDFSHQTPGEFVE